MKNLINAVRNQEKQRLAEFIEAINQVKNISDLDKWQYADLLPKGKKITALPLPDAKAYLISRKEKQIYKRIESEVGHIETVMNAGTLQSVKISVEWKRSRTWGANPTAEAWASFIDKNGNRDSKYVKTSPVSGCGYDKLSTAVANALNQFNEVLKPLYAVKNQPKNIDKKSNEVFGYGAGYGIEPRLEGGVGVSCYPKIFEKIGYKFETVASGKSFDVFQITKK